MIEGRDFAAVSTVGARARQEDDWGTHVCPPAQEQGARLLAAVADGMGGMPAGDQASGIAIRAFLDSYRVIDLPAAGRLRHALAHANREVGIAVETDPAREGMGCTLVTALFFPDRCEWLSVGDSLILRSRNGELERINPLHVYANELNEMVRRGELSEDAALKHEERAALTSAVQGTILEEVAQGVLTLEAGDVVMLASDGILTLPDDEIASICREQAQYGAERIAQTIVDRIDVRSKRGQDNATLVVVRPDVGVDDARVVRKVAPGVMGDVREESEYSAAATQDAADTDIVDVESEDGRSSAFAAIGAATRMDENQPDTRAGSTNQPDRNVHSIPGKPQADRLFAGLRLLWLPVAFVLGAACGVIGWYVFTMP